MRRFALLVAVAAFAAAPAARAHNAGHVILADGSCHNVGSLKEAPYVGAGNPNQTSTGQLDLIDDPRGGVDTSDQYGARFAATRGQSRVEPGECP